MTTTATETTNNPTPRSSLQSAIDRPLPTTRDSSDDNNNNHHHQGRLDVVANGRREEVPRRRRDRNRRNNRKRTDKDKDHHDSNNGKQSNGGDNDSVVTTNERTNPHGPPSNQPSSPRQPSSSQPTTQHKTSFNSKTPSHLPTTHQFVINPNTNPDIKLTPLPNEDPRGNDPTKRITHKAKKKGNGMNTESFDPASTLVRPDLRVCVGSNGRRVYGKRIKHDDVVIVPELFGDEENWDTYYKLVEEMRALQKENVRDSEWISWHEGAHLISKNPQGSPTFEKVIDRLCEYFTIRRKSIGTRFNWYRDSSDWKPFHHDSAAYNPNRAKTQNITVGISFGAMRELAFLRAAPQENGEKVKVYFPQTNNGVFSFGRDVNILWKHGINALLEEEQDGKGRISIILWGLADGVVEEDGSPPLLGSDGQGPHAQRGGGGRGNRGGRGHGRGQGRGRR